MKKILLPIIIFLLSVTTAWAINFPKPTGHVNDFAGVIDLPNKAKLEEKLVLYKSSTSNEIAVVTIKNLEGNSIEDYSIKLADAWKVGDKEKDNGVILLFAMEDRKMRIEVGQGLEGALTDIESKHIIDEVITPEFKSSNYAKGVDMGVDAVILSIAGEYVNENPQATTDGSGAVVLLIILGILFVIFIVAVAESPYTPIGGQGTYGITSLYKSSGGSFFSSGSSSSSGSSGGGFGGFGGGSFGGGGSSGSW